MSDQQLTVAELLARSGKDKRTSGRRRRRSLEEGGVSIAELTGNIPKVDATPVAGKHNTESIEGVDRAPAQPAQGTDQAVGVGKQEATAQAAQPSQASQNTQVEQAAHAAQTAQPAADAVKDDAAAPAAPAPAAASTASSDTAAANSASSSLLADAPKAEAANAHGAAAAAAGKDPKAQPQAPKFEVPKTTTLQAVPEPAKPAGVADDAQTGAKAPAKPKVAAPSASNDETVILSVVDENDPVRLTTGTFPAVKKTSAATQVAASTLGEVKDQAAPDAQAATAATGAATTTPRKPELGEAIEAAPVPAALVNPDAAPEAANLPVAAASEELAGIDEEGSGVSVGAIILQALLGVALGVVVFAGFQYLWANLGRGLVAVLAAVVAVLIIFVVNKLNSAHDRLLTVLSVLVAIVLTFGPLLTV